ncbi:MAG: phosphohydrolase [Candidatus Omnitrophica bacterium]|nr:phosphohydrolase [Candidatus Omnitrophota bacterium]MBU1090867.1 phosphohydrolase [Candidatus Omnitrophota bacterium]MBU1905857.1 phosphohydrolase [Candidatus Omnitrophota bacterium]
MSFKCPGQDERHLKAEIIQCPECGYKVEIFSDEVEVRCPKCKGLACRDRLPSCVDWCKYARKCVGEDKWRKLKKS